MIPSVITLCIYEELSILLKEAAGYAISPESHVVKITQHGRIVGGQHGEVMIGYFPIGKFFCVARLTGSRTNKRNRTAGFHRKRFLVVFGCAATLQRYEHEVENKTNYTE
jgi:hypothetical protein